MEALKSLVLRAQNGDLNAYASLVRRFQDMAIGYAQNHLGDRFLAEDAAQEAFIQVYFDLPRLRNPAAFSGWLRKIVFKHCDRITRRASGIGSSNTQANIIPLKESEIAPMFQVWTTTGVSIGNPSPIRKPIGQALPSPSTGINPGIGSTPPI